MPGVSGPELAEQLLARRPNLKLLYMSGYSERSLESLNTSGAEADFIQKPFTSSALAEKARRLLHPL
jgi:two-component system cell cycle sensor histidine kinase/response regulator CckA